MAQNKPPPSNLVTNSFVIKLVPTKDFYQYNSKSHVHPLLQFVGLSSYLTHRMQLVCIVLQIRRLFL